MELRRRDKQVLFVATIDLSSEQPEVSRNRSADEHAPQVCSEIRCPADWVWRNGI